MTKEKIQSAKSLCEKATEGPWKYGFGDGDESGLWSTTVFDTIHEPTHDKEPRMILYGTIDDASDSAFIAASRTLLPQALDALDEAHRKLDRVNALWEKWDEEADFAANEMDPRTAETLNRCVQQIGEILLGESTT